VEPTFQRESGLASFGTKVVLFLNGVDPSFINTVAGSYFEKQSGLNILHDSADDSKAFSV
jgi:hypothetical protein